MLAIHGIPLPGVLNCYHDPVSSRSWVALDANASRGASRMLPYVCQRFLDDAKDRQLNVSRQPSEPRSFERNRDSGALRIAVQTPAKGYLQTCLLEHEEDAADRRGL